MAYTRRIKETAIRMMLPPREHTIEEDRRNAGNSRRDLKEMEAGT